MTASRSGKSQAAFRTISEVADELDVAQHVLRFWESKFPQVRPLKRGGGRRYYRPEDIELLRDIRSLLYDEGYTIKGAQKLLRQRRARAPALPATKPSIPLSSADQPTVNPVPGTGSVLETGNEPLQHQLNATMPAPTASNEAAPDSLLDAEPDPAPAALSLPQATADDDLERLRQVRNALVTLRHDLATLLTTEDG